MIGAIPGDSLGYALAVELRRQGIPFLICSALTGQDHVLAEFADSPLAQKTCSVRSFRFSIMAEFQNLRLWARPILDRIYDARPGGALVHVSCATGSGQVDPTGNSEIQVSASLPSSIR